MLLFALLFQLNRFLPNNFRDGYTEIFYPVSLEFIFYMIGLFLLVTYLLNLSMKKDKLSFLMFFGKHSLQAYFTHIVLIKIYTICFTQDVNNFNYLIPLIGAFCIYFLTYLFIKIITSYTLHPSYKKNSITAFLLGL